VLWDPKRGPEEDDGMSNEITINIGISESDRRAIADGLSHLLADTYTLYLKTHNYHWNVVGPMFNTLHLMFEQQYMELALAVDLIAERIRALGEPAPASYREFSQLSTVAEDTDQPDAIEMIRRLVEGQETVVRTARSVFPVAEAADDEPTADLLTQRMQVHEKTAWMLRSMVA
jgi:starvation-inducible DNA-binding protein